MSDYYNIIDSAEKRAREEGREEGEKIKAIQIAQKLISTGMSLEEACEFVGISKDTMILS